MLGCGFVSFCNLVVNNF